jgi:predicted acyltransferase
MHTATTDFTQRNAAIDILRALTMLLMIFVNDFWSVSGVPGWMLHAKRAQDMLGLADIVFPCFLFVVGMSIPFAIERRFSKGLSGVSTVGHILSRSLALLIMGVFIVNTEAGLSPECGLSRSVYRILMVTGFLLVWNVYPHSENSHVQRSYTLLKIIGLLLLFYLAIIFRDTKGGVFQARWWGILGLIGWTYLICAFVYLFTRDRLKYLIPVWLVFITLCILKSATREGTPLLNLPEKNFLDECLRILHIENGAHPAFTMGGIILSLISTKYKHLGNLKKIMAILIIVAFLFLAGFISHKFWIISKIQTTPSWVFYCTAISVGAYAIIYGLVEKGKAHWFNIIKVAGTATLTCYLVPFAAYSVSSLIGIKLPEWLTVGFVGLLNCATFSFMMIGITYLLGRIHIKLKI